MAFGTGLLRPCVLSARCRRGATVLALLAACAVAARAGGADADAGPAAVPYRPSVSTPATLSTPGWLEVEGGVLHERDGAARRDSLPVTLKLAFTPDWGVRVGADAWARTRDDAGHRAHGLGDTTVVLKRRFAIDDRHAFGLEAGATLPTSRHGTGNGSSKADFGVNAIYSGDFADWHADLNLVATRLGAPGAGRGRLEQLYAAALSTPLDERWGVVGEISGSRQRGAGGASQLLAAASYSVSKRLVLDAGATRSLHSGAPAWSGFAGFTWLAGRAF